jgi:WD40 repeat protein/serine/threonine protein kinase
VPGDRAERELLFETLAVHLGFITQDTADEFQRARSGDRQSADRVAKVESSIALGALTDKQRDLLQSVTDQLFDHYAGDLDRCLEALKSSGGVLPGIIGRMGQGRNSNEHPTVASAPKNGEHLDPASRGAMENSGPADWDDDSFVSDGLGGDSDEAVAHDAKAAERSFGALASNDSRFRVIRPHAQGGIGKVSVAFDNELRREVALKQIKSERADDAESRGRFVLEAEVTGRLEHPGIVPIYSLGKDDNGSPYYVMRFVRGQSLEQAIQSYHRADGTSARDAPARSLELRSLLDRFADVCHTVAYAHSRGVLHRDLKPANIMLGPFNESLVVDWGLAKEIGAGAGREKPGATQQARPVIDAPQERDPSVQGAAVDADERRTDSGTEAPLGLSSSTDTQAGTALGTPAFMSPEQAEGLLDQLSPTSDVYSLGAVLYTLLCGKTPFEYVWCDVTSLMSRVKLGEFPRPRAVNPRVPRALEAVCLKAMATRPEDRYSSATELAKEIKRWLADEPVTCYRDPPVARLARWGRTNKPIVAGAAALVFTTLVGLTAGVFLLGREQRETEKQRLTAIAQGAIATEKAEALRRRDAVSRVNLAYREYLDDNVALADELLNGCPHDLREWEYEYARRLGHSELKSYWGSSYQRDVWSLAFSPDGAHLASGSGQWSYVGDGPTGELLVLTTQTGDEVFKLSGLAGAVQAVAFAPDGRKLAAAWGYTGQNEGATLAVFEMPTGRKVWEKPERGIQILGLAYSPDGREIASGCGRFNDPDTIGFARLRDAATGEPRGSAIAGGPGGVLSVAYSPDGKQLALASRDIADICDLTSPRREVVHRLRGHANFIYAVAFSPDGRTLATGGWDKTIRVWDPKTGKELRTLLGHRGFVRGLAFSADGGQLVSGSEDKSVRRWDLANGADNAAFHGHTGFVHCVAFGPDGATAASGSQDATIKLWPAAAPDSQVTFRNSSGWIGTVALAPDGRLVATAHSGNIRIWDPRTGEELHRLPGPQTLMGHIALGFSPDGTTLAASGQGPALNLWDTATWTTRSVIAEGVASVDDVDFSPDGKLLVMACGDGFIRMRNLSKPETLWVIQGHPKRTAAVTFSPDGHRIASGGDDPIAKVWDAATGKLLMSFSGHKYDVHDVAFSPDGQTVASVGGTYKGPDAAEVRLWNSQTGSLEAALDGHTSLVTAVAYFPSGRRLATASDDRTIKLWDTHTHEDVFTLRGHTSGVLALAISRDGRQLVSGSIDHAAKTWSTVIPDPSVAAELSIRRAAVERVQSLFAKHLLKADVLEALRTEKSLSPALKATAIEVAERRTENASGLYQAGWVAVLQPGREANEYRLAMRRLEAACQVVVSDPERRAQYCRALALAYYRAGEPAKAIQTIEGLGTLRATSGTGAATATTPTKIKADPIDQALVALAAHALGHTARAHAMLEQLRAIVQNNPTSKEQESHVVVREALETVGTRQ